MRIISDFVMKFNMHVLWNHKSGYVMWASPYEVKKNMKYKEQLCASETFVCLYELLLKSRVVCRYAFCGISRWSFVSFLYNISPRGKIQFSSCILTCRW